MNGTAVFEEWPFVVKAFHYVLGTVILFVALFFIVFGVMANQPIGLLLGLVFCIPGIIQLYNGYSRAWHRVVRVDAAGIRFIQDGKLCWDLPWSSIRMIGTKRKPADRDHMVPDGPTISVPGSGYDAIQIATDRFVYFLRVGTDFGTTKSVREIFLLLVQHAVARGIAVEDGLGWGPGAQLLPRQGLTENAWPGGILTPPAGLNIAEYEGIWHRGHVQESPGTVQKTVFGIVALGAICCILGVLLGIPLILSLIGLVLIFTGTVVGIGAFREMSIRISAILFNREGLYIQNGKGLSSSLRWNQVHRCKLDTDTRCISLETDSGNYNGVFETRVQYALGWRFVLATGRPAETWSSGATPY